MLDSTSPASTSTVESTSAAPSATEVLVNNSPSADDLAASAAIDAIAASWVADPAEDDDAPAETPADPAAIPVVAAETAPLPESAPEKTEDRGLERLIARELDVRTKEEAIATREKALSASEARIAELEAQIARVPSDLLANLGVDPGAALTAAGHDPDQVMRLYLARKMQAKGDKVPPELLQAIREADRDVKEKQLLSRVNDFERRQAVAQFVAQVEQGAHQYVTTGISKDAPTVAAVAAKQPERVRREILDEISRDATNRAGKEPNGALMTYETAAKRVEARWAEMRSLFGPAEAPPAASTSPVVTTPASKTAANQASSKQPPAVKPPQQPIQPWKASNEAELMAEGIRVAEAEYRKQEQAARTR